MMTTHAPNSGRSQQRRNALGAATVAGTLLLVACVSCSDRNATTTTSSTTTTATTTTATTTTAVTTTAAPVTTVPPSATVVTAPPGRLAAVDVTAKITALFPTPFPSNNALSLATETITRLRSSFDAIGFSAELRGVSLVTVERTGRPIGSVMAYVIEVRNREASGDDSTPGYDLVITMERGDSGNWTITKAEEQRICSRGNSTSGGLPVCV